MKNPEEKLRNNIGMQMNFYQYSGATMEDTIERIYRLAMDYAEKLQHRIDDLEIDNKALKDDVDGYRDMANQRGREGI